MFRYLVDITRNSDRTFRLSLLAGIIGVSVPIAHFSSIYIYQAGNMAVFWTTLALLTSALGYAIFFVKESLPPIPKNEAEFVKTFPDKNSKLVIEDYIEKDEPQVDCVAILKNLMQCFVVTFKPREGYKRACILILMTTMCLTLLTGC